MYTNGEGTPADPARALAWFEQAAAQGHAAAQYNCAMAYLWGRGTQKNRVKAKKWLTAAANQTGDAVSQMMARTALEENF